MSSYSVPIFVHLVEENNVARGHEIWAAEIIGVPGSRREAKTKEEAVSILRRSLIGAKRRLTVEKLDFSELMVAEVMDE